MNRQELIEKYELGLKDVQLKFGANYKTKVYEGVLDDLKQLDEPQKVTVQQFIADWIEYCKNTNVTMTRALLVGEVDFYNYANQKDHFQLVDFLGSRINQETFACAWLDGYTVEEKRYTVKIKAVDQYLVSVKDEKFLGFLQGRLRSKFTQKELEDAGFGWVFDCPGIEIEEVE